MSGSQEKAPALSEVPISLGNATKILLGIAFGAAAAGFLAWDRHQSGHEVQEVLERHPDTQIIIPGNS